MQNGQQNLQLASPRAQTEISALAARLGKEFDYPVKRQDRNCDRIFVALRKILRRQMMNGKTIVYEETKQYVEFYTNC